MKIFLDARIQRVGGVRTYIMNFTRTLLALDRENQYTVLMDSSNRIDLSGFENAGAESVKNSNELYWIYVNNCVLPPRLNRSGYDLYHSLKQIGVVYPHIPRIVTLHTGAIFDYRKHWPLFVKIYWKWAYIAAVKLFDAVIAVSSADRREILNHVRVDPGKVNVVYLAPGPEFRVIDDRDSLESVRRRYGLPEKFILFVGVLYPFKNIETIIRAYSLLRRRVPSLREKLVIVGRKGWHCEGIFRLIPELGLEEHVVCTGNISDDLPEIYNLAEFLVFPSIYEACPFPPLEAMASGIPVIVSRRGGLPEIAGDAGCYLDDPLDSRTLSEHMERLLTDRDLRRDLTRKGLEQVKSFTWERCVKETLAIYRQFSSFSHENASSFSRSTTLSGS
jgi:glycosyltransferase involved in cell wall biosynthesis